MTERERFIAILDRSPAHFCDLCHESPEERAESIKKLADALLAADVVEVRHGVWKKHGNEKTCSLCKFIYYSNNDEWNFCPNCGAKMDGERREG